MASEVKGDKSSWSFRTRCYSNALSFLSTPDFDILSMGADALLLTGHILRTTFILPMKFIFTIPDVK